VNQKADNILVSVVIPTYNREYIISEAINSVLNQTYQNFEILVVDDGSTDKTKEVVENIKDPRIRYICQHNAGPSAARNNGIRNAKGDWIAFLDSDDIWLPEKLGKQIEVINSSDDRLGIVTCWSLNCYYKNNLPVEEVNISIATNSQEFIRGLILDPSSVITGTNTIIIRKTSFEKVGLFNEDVRAYEDWDVWFRVATNYDFKCVNEVLAHNRTTNGSLSLSTNLDEVKKGYLNFLQNLFNETACNHNILSLKELSYSNAYWYIGRRSLFQAKDKKFARESFLKSIKYSSSKLLKPTFIIAFILSFMPIKLLQFYIIVRPTLKRLLNLNK
jgi:glycosyltransferase involved in cell wall biosynthesis